MSNSAEGLLTGLIYIVIWMIKNTHSATHHSCQTHHLASGINVNCSGDKVHSTVPTNLPIDMRSLDLSNNNLCAFNRYNFTNYASLQELLMTHLTCRRPRQFDPSEIITLENDTFADLISLQLLDISNSPICGFGTMRFHWPKRLIHLSLNHVHNVAFDFRELKELEQLFVANCSKHVFPSLHPSAPIRTLDLQANHISGLKVEDVANFCKLESLFINIWAVDYFNMEEKFESGHVNVNCLCERLKEWTKQKNIHGVGDLNCPTTIHVNGRTVNVTYSCNMSFDTANLLYDTCIDKNRYEHFILLLRILIIIVAAISITCPAVYVTVKAWSIYTGRRSQIIAADPYTSDDYSSLYEFESDYDIGKHSSRTASDHKKSERKKSVRKKSDRKKSDSKKSDLPPSPKG